MYCFVVDSFILHWFHFTKHILFDRIYAIFEVISTFIPFRVSHKIAEHMKYYWSLNWRVKKYTWTKKSIWPFDWKINAWQPGVIPKHVAILNVIANHILYLKYKNNGDVLVILASVIGKNEHSEWFNLGFGKNCVGYYLRTYRTNFLIWKFI